jgi:glycosyltransferase involved in cell wall biosynthesis
MHITYLCPSPSFGMHQYTADMANRMAGRGHRVAVVTTARLPRDRYGEGVEIHTPVANRTTGFSREGLDRGAFRGLRDALLAAGGDVMHITSPHLWNPLLIHAARRAGRPVIQTLHDLDPHYGSPFAALIPLWNDLVIRAANHILVHAQCYRARLLARGASPGRVTELPLLHLFVGNAKLPAVEDLADAVAYEPWALFFGRLEPYKGIEHLLAAGAMLDRPRSAAPSIVVVGPGHIAPLWAGALPHQVTVREGLVADDEALALFRRCACLVLPYVDATQSALIAAAYYFRKPVIVTRSGALPEYVEHGRTGLVIEPQHPPSLARALERLLHADGLLKQMGQAGRAWYERQRAAEEAALLAMYERVASNHPQFT